MRRSLIVSLAMTCALPAWGDTIGVWNFNQAEKCQVPNQRPGGIPAVLKDFAPTVLEGVDVEMIDFSISRSNLRTTVRVARSGWATFKGIPDNGLEKNINTPVGERALAIFSEKPGNWVHIPGLASAWVGRSGNSIRSAAFAAWYLLQTEGETPQFAIRDVNCLFRVGRVDARLQTFRDINRFFTEDVGNGLGPKHRYDLPSSMREAAAARWFHVAVSADGEVQKFQMWVNGQAVQYPSVEGAVDSYPWPRPGGLEISWKEGHESDGAVIGRWLGGFGASGRTMGLAALVVLKDESIDQKRAHYLYELGRKGIPFDGNWFSQKVEDQPRK